MMLLRGDPLCYPRSWTPLKKVKILHQPGGKAEGRVALNSKRNVDLIVKRDSQLNERNKRQSKGRI